MTDEAESKGSLQVSWKPFEKSAMRFARIANPGLLYPEFTLNLFYFTLLYFTLVYFTLVYFADLGLLYPDGTGDQFS